MPKNPINAAERVCNLFIAFEPAAGDGWHDKCLIAREEIKLCPVS
jgi:hypothetical protein